MVFEYAGQEVATVHITVNDGNEIPNELIYGTIKGYKVNRETGDKISGALFGLFRADESSFTENNALLTAESGEDGVFTFENVVYGSYTVRELRPAAGYLENETVYAVTVDKDGDVVEITVVNDLIPEIGTTATIDDENEVCATEVFTLTDTVEYKHLVPGKEYTVKGILMDKATGEPFLQNGEQITSEVTFVPEAPSGSVEVLFTFDAKLIKTNTNIVVFESLYSDSKELTVHADIEDEAQTVTVIVPESVAEHSWRISLMAFLLRHEFKDIDINKVVDMCLIHDLGECFTGDIPTFVKTDSDRDVEDSLLNQWVKTLPAELSEDIAALYKEMDAQETKEAKLYKSLDKLEALIQHNESPLDTWSENEFELNKTYAFDTVAFSSWLTELREVILEDTMKKIESGS